MNRGHSHRNLPTFGSPDRDSPWTSVQRKAQELTKERIDTWRDSDLSNLLIFASLFSTILTSFTIEAGRDVRVDDPAEKTVLLLQTLVLQVHNITNPQVNFPINLTPSAVITPHAQHIYLLYSVSLTLSFAAVLGGILCLQWLRESSRNVKGASHNNELYFQFQRHRSLQRWGVMVFINLLELLLLVSLFLFFTAFLISQWESKTLAAIPVTVLVILGLLFTLVTSCLPTLQAIWLAEYDKPGSTILEPAHEPPPPVLCPYRSPQAWMFHSVFQFLHSFVRYILRKNVLPKHLIALLCYANNWTHYDAWWAQKLQHRERDPQSLFSALFWVVGQVKQSKDVVFAVYQCFVSSTADMCSEYLSTLSEYEEVSEDVWIAFGFPMLSRFEEEFTIDVLERDVIWKIRLWLFSEIWMEMRKNNLRIRGSSSLYLIFGLGELAEEAEKELLKVVHNTLEDPASTWITDDSAVAVTCHVIKQRDLRLDIWCEIIPILIGLCGRYQQGIGRPLEPIDRLCRKLRKRMSLTSSHSAVISIFNEVFPVVDHAHLDDLGVTIGNLLACNSEKCNIFPGFAIKFLEIVEDLVYQRRIIETRSLDNTVLYTAHVIEHSYNPSDILPSIHKTFKAILLSVKDYVSLESNISKDFVLHPSRLSIRRPLWDDKNGTVWSVIEDFNNKLKEIWSPYDEGGDIEILQAKGGREISAVIEPEGVGQGENLLGPVGVEINSPDQYDNSDTGGQEDPLVDIIPETGPRHESSNKSTPSTELPVEIVPLEERAVVDLSPTFPENKVQL